MISVQFPPPSFRIENGDDYDKIFDVIRKQWVKLTPEEWVRQNFIAYLQRVQNVPASLIGVEKEIKVGELRKRFDIAVFKNDGRPWMLIECKSMDVELSEKVLQQALSYRSAMNCEHLLITNGSYTYGWQLNSGQPAQLHDFPAFGTS